MFGSIAWPASPCSACLPSPSQARQSFRSCLVPLPPRFSPFLSSSKLQDYPSMEELDLAGEVDSGCIDVDLHGGGLHLDDGELDLDGGGFD